MAFRFLFFVFLGIGSSFGFAQTGDDNEGWTLGIFTTYGAASVGEGEKSLQAFPILQYDLGPWTFGGQAIATYTWVNPSPKAEINGRFLGLRSTLGLGADFGQDVTAAGLPEVDLAPTALLKLTYDGFFYQASAEWASRLDSDGGSRFTAGLGTGYPVSDTLILTLGASATYGNADYRAVYYGLEEAGLMAWDISALGIFTGHDQVTVLAGLTYEVLDDSVTAQPFVTEENSLFLVLGFAYDL